MTAVWEHSQHKGSELLLLLALADFAHDDGSSIYPSNAKLCEKVRMVERSVRYILRKLERSGELVVEGKHHAGTTRYRIDMALLGGAKIAPAKIAPRQNDANKGAKSSVTGGQPIAPDPLVKNHQETPEETDDQFIRRVSLRYKITSSAARTLAKMCIDEAGQLRRPAFEEVAYKNRSAR